MPPKIGHMPRTITGRLHLPRRKAVKEVLVLPHYTRTASPSSTPTCQPCPLSRAACCSLQTLWIDFQTNYQLRYAKCSLSQTSFSRFSSIKPLNALRCFITQAANFGFDSTVLMGWDVSMMNIRIVWTGKRSHSNVSDIPAFANILMWGCEAVRKRYVLEALLLVSTGLLYICSHQHAEDTLRAVWRCVVWLR